MEPQTLNTALGSLCITDERLTPQGPHLHAEQQTAVMIGVAITSYLHKLLINSQSYIFF